jgi:hypothetical protein
MIQKPRVRCITNAWQWVNECYENGAAGVTPNGSTLFLTARVCILASLGLS